MSQEGPTLVPDGDGERPQGWKDIPSDEADVSPWADWVNLVDRIRRGDESGMTDLYSHFSQGVRFYFCRHLGTQELDDKVHDTFVIVVQAIQRGDLREPSRLMGFVRTVVRRQLASYISQAMQGRRENIALDTGSRVPDMRCDPEEAVLESEKLRLMTQILGGISRRDREILTRFYLKGETQEEICREMDLTETQFRLLKSRAKARFGELGRRKIAQRQEKKNLRKSAGA